MNFVQKTLFVSKLKSFSPVLGLTEVRWKSKNRPITYDHLIHPRPMPGEVSLRRKVHFPEKYTVKPLDITNLAGRDPVSGRVVVATLGGGIKYKYHWIEWVRKGPTSPDEPPVEEEIIDIIFDGNRSARVALVASGDDLKYYLAPHGLKPGDIIRTSSYIPKILVQNPNIGDAHPLGALQDGTMVHNVERLPGEGSRVFHSAGTYGTIMKHANGKVHIRLPSKNEFICDEKCMAVVGRVSNLEHSSIPIGSPNRLRQLGYRPRSGLWQRKDGRFGRKIHPPRTYVTDMKEKNYSELMLDTVLVPRYNFGKVPDVTWLV